MLSAQCRVGRAGAGAGGACARRRASCGPQRVLTMQSVNPAVVKLQYAVRGPLLMRAEAIIKELKEGAKKPFQKVIRANLGDGHAMGQKPITFIRQVVACVTYPDIMSELDLPSDVKERAQCILESCGGRSVGAYSDSLGVEFIRRHVAAYIEQRDGHPVTLQNISLIGGASNGIKNVLELFCNNPRGKPSGVMIPIPQYPLYSATIDEFRLQSVPYYLDEDNNWGLDLAEMERAYKEGMERSDVRVLVVINPGNPTGQVLTKQNVETCIKFAHEKKLFIFADEVYQSNVYDPESKFYSFKKVMFDMGAPYNTLELASFMSASKGYSGECGLRAGWMEIVNMDPEVQENLYKFVRASLCPSVPGQAAMDCIAKPPAKGEESYELWNKEVTAVLDLLKQRSIMCYETFNKMKGFKCNKLQGAMYAFPKLEIPPKAIEAAKQEKRNPDVFYAFKLLEETGICVVAGSGFGQRPGTHHFRTTILPQPPLLKEMLTIFQKFHEKFTNEYS